MPSNKKTYQIVKVPLGYTPEIKLPNFPPIPRLYLELLENKAKVKAHLRNLEWEPKETNDLPSFRTVQSKVEKEVEDETRGDDTTVPWRPTSQTQQQFDPPPPPVVKGVSFAEQPSPREHFSHESASPSREPYSSQREPSPAPSLAEASWSRDLSPRSSPPKSQDTLAPASLKETRQNPLREKFGSFLSRIPESEISESQPSDDYHSYSQPTSQQSSYSSNNDSYDQPSHSGFTQEQNDIFAKMKEIEDGLASDTARSSNNNAASILDRPQTYTFVPSNKEEVPQRPQEAPSLKQVFTERQSHQDPKILRETPYGETSRGVTEKKDILFKFNLLRKQHPEIPVPDFTEYTDIETLKAEYDKITRQLRLDSTVENWRTGLVYGFYIMEFVVGTYLKWADLKGFTSDQLLHMNRYDKILYELGEKHYNTPALNLGPELTLILTVCSNAVMFGLKKKFLGKMGQTVMGSMSQASPKTPTSSAAGSSETSKPKMKGPDLNLDDILNKKNS